MTMTREQMDRLVDEHFTYEARDDVDGVVARLAAEVRHEVVPSPYGQQTDKAAIRAFYRNLFSDLRGEGVTPVRRLYGDDFVVDESIWHGQVVDGRLFMLPGHSGRVSFRLLHVFELADGKIANEAVWCDLAALQRQLGASPLPATR
jgi:predicted ester cyclase